MFNHTHYAVAKKEMDKKESRKKKNVFNFLPFRSSLKSKSIGKYSNEWIPSVDGKGPHPYLGKPKTDQYQHQQQQSRDAVELIHNRQYHNLGTGNDNTTKSEVIVIPSMDLLSFLQADQNRLESLLRDLTLSEMCIQLNDNDLVAVTNEIGCHEKQKIPFFVEHSDIYPPRPKDCTRHKKIIPSVNNIMEETKMIFVHGINQAKKIGMKCLPNLSNLCKNVAVQYKETKASADPLSREELLRNLKRRRLEMRRRAEARRHAEMTFEDSDDDSMI